MNLLQSLRLSPAPRLAFVGAGGKTTALFRLARDFSAPVLVTTTTHLSVEQAQLGDRHIIVESPSQIESLSAHPLQGITVYTAPPDASGRLGGLSGESLDRLLRLADEYGRAPAGGSRWLAPATRQSPRGARAGHPGFCRYGGGRGGLIRPGQASLCADRPPPAGVRPLSRRCLPAKPSTPPRSSRVLLHPQGGLKGIPPGARRILLLNQADTDLLQSQAHAMLLGRPDQPSFFQAYHAVIIASLIRSEIYAVHEPVAGILLAAGGASRYGSPKQLLDLPGRAPRPPRRSSCPGMRCFAADRRQRRLYAGDPPGAAGAGCDAAPQSRTGRRDKALL